MSLNVRTFQVRAGDSQAEDESAVAHFLKSVDVDRVDTAFSDGAWRLLVLYRDRREREESEQIASVIAFSLRSWRTAKAKAEGMDPSEVLSDEVLTQVAQFVPTTTLELRVVLGQEGAPISPFEEDIVHVVREALDELV